MRMVWMALICAGLAAGETDPRAREWLLKAQEQAGGVAKLESVRDVMVTRHMSNAAAGMNAEQTVRYVLPSVLRQESALPFGNATVYVGPEGGWMNTPQGQVELGGPQLRQARGEVFRLREALLLSDRLDDRELRFVREADDAGRKAVVLEAVANAGGETAEIWIDKDSLDFYKLAYQGVALAGQPPRVEERYSDFRQVAGLRIPHKTSIYQDGRLLTDVTVIKAAINSGTTTEELARKP